MWDERAGRAGRYDEVPADHMALEGGFEVGGVACRPAFDLLREHLRKFSVESVTTLALVLLAGPVIYVIARAVRSGSSIDLDLAMRELPPE